MDNVLENVDYLFKLLNGVKENLSRRIGEYDEIVGCVFDIKRQLTEKLENQDSKMFVLVDEYDTIMLPLVFEDIIMAEVARLQLAIQDSISEEEIHIYEVGLAKKGV